jgi:hypothetical protein
MPVRLKTAVVFAGAGALTAAMVLAGATPAFAKSNTTLTESRAGHARNAFRLTVLVGDDGGARRASARLQVRDRHGRFQWYGTWHSLHRTDWSDESCTFTVTGRHNGAETFRAIVTNYAITNNVTVVAR